MSKQENWHDRVAFRLNATYEMEECHIYKPWYTIFRAWSIYLVWFAFLTLCSYKLLTLFMIPIWIMILYEFFISLEWMKKFNISMLKVSLWTGVVEIGFIAAAPHVRNFLVWLITDASRYLLRYLIE